MPPKYREMKSFWKYYSGQEVAPVPTIFIGGNHEASNYLWELLVNLNHCSFAFFSVLYLCFYSVYSMCALVLLELISHLCFVGFKLFSISALDVQD